MLETLKFIRPVIEDDARQIDQGLIRNRTSAVARNYTQLTDVNRSSKFMERKGGLDERRSQTQDSVIWFASTAIEDPDKAAMVEALWTPLFSYARSRGLFVPLSFWDVHDEIHGLLLTARRSYLDGSRIEARFNAIKIREKANELIRLCDGIAAAR